MIFVYLPRRPQIKMDERILFFYSNALLALNCYFNLQTVKGSLPNSKCKIFEHSLLYICLQRMQPKMGGSMGGATTAFPSSFLRNTLLRIKEVYD